jgi:carbohydrate kinase (thermoresistant glucokinase family)
LVHPEGASPALRMNIIVLGVAGSGKTTVGRTLAARLGEPWRFIDADQFHPAANIEKMSRGLPLDDVDRAPWLARLGERLDACGARGQHVVLACSALKEAYRRTLAASRGATRFVYLKGDPEVLLARLRARRNHFMKACLLRSQLKTLEAPAPGAALVVDAALPPDEIVTRVLREFGLPARQDDSSPRRP